MNQEKGRKVTVPNPFPASSLWVVVIAPEEGSARPAYLHGIRPDRVLLTHRLADAERYPSREAAAAALCWLPIRVRITATISRDCDL
jgi:hypothetical protein